MSWKNQARSFLVSYLAEPLVRLLFASCRKQIIGLESFLQATSGGKIVLSLWHENLLVMPYFLNQYMKKRPVSALVSKSRDGKLLEFIASRLLDIDIILVAHDARHGSLKQMKRALDEGRTVVITPDGPQGPWKQVKKGAAFAAHLSGATLWALSLSTDDPNTQKKGWRLPTPDKMKMPRPFQKITITLKEVGMAKEREEVEMIEKKLAQALD